MRVLISTVLFLSEIAFSGSISSGGSGFIKDGLNPWFLENTKVARYCIESDRTYFPFSTSELKSDIEFVFKAWKNALGLASYWVYEDLEPFKSIRLATQRFEFGSCDANTDLRFQFGVLSQQQQRDFSNFKDYIGAAVRTHYSAHDMKGRGYIYIAPTRGPLRPDYKEMDEYAWESCHRCVLRLTLMHELGHIFGIEHFGSIMGKSHIEFMTSRTIQQQIEAEPERYQRLIDNRISYYNELKYRKEGDQRYLIDSTDHIRSLLRISTDHNLIQFNRAYDKNDNLSHIEVLAAANRNEPLKPIGRIDPRAGVGENSTGLTQIWIPRDQQVFTNLPKLKFHRYIEGLSRTTFSFEGIYHSFDDQVRSEIDIHFEPGNVVSGYGERKGKLVSFTLFK